MVHGDDFISIETKESSSWMKCRLEEHFEVKTTLIGNRKGEALEGRVLNRVIRASAGREHEETKGTQSVGWSANTVTTPEDAKKEKEENKATMFRQKGLGQWRSLISKKDPAWFISGCWCSTCAVFRSWLRRRRS